MEQQFDKGKIKGLSTGWKEIDPHFTWRFGEPTLLNGYFNNGKTTFEYNLMLGAAILYDWKFGAFMPENYPVNEAYDSLCEIYIGKTSDIEKHDRMNKQEYKDAAKFVHNHIKLISNNKRFSPADIRSISKQMIMQYGIVGIFTDPWKALKHHMGNKSIDLYLEDELQEEIDFALKHKCIKVIATHPPTPIRNKEKEYPAPSAFEVKGGEVWASMIYNQMCIHIPQDRSFEDTTTELHIQKIKNQKLVGIPTRRDNPILLKFDRKSGRYTDTLGTSPFDALDRQEKIKFEQPYYDF
jgi:twinkle protein